MKEKYCRKCDEWWPADSEFFHRNAGNPDGLAYSCKACYAEAPSVLKRDARQYTNAMYSEWERTLGLTT